MRSRVSIAIAIGIFSSLLCWLILERFQLGAGDFSWAIRAARDLVARRDPYDYPHHNYAIPYPLTAALVGLPFIWLPDTVGGALFFGLSSGLLAFGLTQHGYDRLWIFLAYPYWAALLTAQWSPLLMTVAFFPLLLPVILPKPHIGLPIALTHLTWRGVLVSAAIGVFSLLLMPDWPLRWLSQLGGYQNFIPLLILPGPLLLLALIHYRDRDVHVLLLAAIILQRWFYDAFILWLIPKSRREILVTATISWGAGIWRWFVMPETIEQVGTISVLFFYLPMLAVVLLRNGLPIQKLLSRQSIKSVSTSPHKQEK